MITKKDRRICDIIIEEVANDFGFTIIEMFNDGRKGEKPQARQICYFLMKKLTKLSLNDCGLIFGFYGKKQDHSTVLHAIKTTQNRIEIYPNLNKRVINIKSIVEIKTKYIEIKDVFGVREIRLCPDY